MLGSFLCIFTLAEERGNVFRSVCLSVRLSVCLSVCLLDYSESSERILMKFLEE